MNDRAYIRANCDNCVCNLPVILKWDHDFRGYFITCENECYSTFASKKLWVCVVGWNRMQRSIIETERR